MMYAYELLEILTKKRVAPSKTGNCFYKDSNGKLRIIDFVETDSDGNLILSEHE